MTWLLNHPLVLLFVFIVVANLVKKPKQAGATPPPANKGPDADATERTRRVQEEIRRKIAERTGRTLVGSPPRPPLPAAGPSSAPPSWNIFQELARQMAEAKRIAEARERAPAAAEAGTQQRMEDEQKSRELAEARRLTEVQRTLQRQSQAAATAVAYRAPDQKTSAVSARDRLLADLREPDSLRRVFVLREILGEPVGLR
jgi:hypothetical protein